MAQLIYKKFNNSFIPCCALNLIQATIGIDFLSKTMYLEDRTVRLQLWYDDLLFLHPVLFYVLYFDVRRLRVSLAHSNYLSRGEGRCKLKHFSPWSYYGLNGGYLEQTKQLVIC